TLVKHYRDLAFMGFIEVLSHLGTILKNFSFCKEDIQKFNPDAVILIDYPGFNLRMAKWAHAKGYKVIYYISPQIWAWKENRAKLIRRCVNKMLVILPFEKTFYEKWHYEVEYVGHPLIEVIKRAREKGPGNIITEGKIIALLPGSRKQEISHKLPMMLKMTQYFPDYKFVIAQAPHIDEDKLRSILKEYPNVLLVKDHTYDLLQQSTVALVTSGTATLETALFGIPEIVCYKGSPISYFLAKRLVRVSYISLVNLIMNKEVVKELIQNDLNEMNLKKELQNILKDNVRQKIKIEYDQLWGKLDEGDASLSAAEHIVSFLNEVNT
ncbi:MAG: lipid-A-disaccharide synthase, partial [Chitinophagaceae bacterium]